MITKCLVNIDVSNTCDHRIENFKQLSNAALGGFLDV